MNRKTPTKKPAPKAAKKPAGGGIKGVALLAAPDLEQALDRLTAAINRAADRLAGPVPSPAATQTQPAAEAPADGQAADDAAVEAGERTADEG